MAPITLLPETQSLIAEKLSEALRTGKSAMACAEVAMGALGHIQDRECFKVKPIAAGFQGVGRIDPAKASGIDHKAYSDAAVAEFRARLAAHVQDHTIIAAAAE